MALELIINFSLFYILWSAYDRHVKKNENHVGYGYIDSCGYERNLNGDLKGFIERSHLNIIIIHKNIPKGFESKMSITKIVIRETIPQVIFKF